VLCRREPNFAHPSCFHATSTDAGGWFTYRDIDAGIYTLRFSGNGYVPEFWGNKIRPREAQYFSVATGEIKTGMNAALRRGGTISGRITARDGSPLKDAYVYVNSPGYSVGGITYTDFSYLADADADGMFSVSGLPAGEYYVEFLPPEGRDLERQWWPGGSARSFAEPVRVSGTATVEEIDATLLAALKQTRVAGADRYETAAAVSRSYFSDGAPTVVLASGADFPDALSGGPTAALRNAPILLTPPDALPTTVVRELKRLAPKRVVILGGSGVISPRIAAELRSLKSVGSVIRLAGADRYATSVAISRWTFPNEHPEVAYIAAGTSAADALSGAPVAARDGAPLLLVAPKAVPQSVADELARLQPARIVILGGPGAVSSAVARELAEHTSARVVRLSGPDRYETSVAVSRYAFEETEAAVAYLASGTGFADALSAAPVAALHGGPILLTPVERLPDTVRRELVRLHLEQAVIVGGTGVVGKWACATLVGVGGPGHYDGGPPSPCS
jgi:putative cell wall-binding protein